jgi:hypothetical protein
MTAYDLPAESKLTKTARVFAIVRDALIILILGLTLIFGAKVISAAQSATETNPAAPVATFDPLTECNPVFESC